MDSLGKERRRDVDECVYLGWMSTNIRNVDVDEHTSDVCDDCTWGMWMNTRWMYVDECTLG